MRVFNNFISLTVTMFFILLGWATSFTEYPLKMEAKLILDSTAIELKNLESFDIDSASVSLNQKQANVFDNFQFELIKSFKANTIDTILIKDFKSKNTTKTFLEEKLKPTFINIFANLRERKSCGCTKCSEFGLFTQDL